MESMDRLEPDHREEVDDLTISNKNYLDLAEEERENLLVYNESILRPGWRGGCGYRLESYGLLFPR